MAIHSENLKSLRKYVKLVLERKLIEPDEIDVDALQSQINQETIAWAVPVLMKKLNVTPIPSGKSEFGLLGSGAYGVVFEVLHNGVRKAMKVTKNRGDAAAYKRIMKVREKLPELPKRALPKIEKQVYDSELRAYGTLMEYLVPLSKSMMVSISNAAVRWVDDLDKGITPGMMKKATKQFVQEMDKIILDLGEDGLNLSANAAKAIVSSEEWQRLKDQISSGKWWPTLPQNAPELTPNKFNNGFTLIDHELSHIQMMTNHKISRYIRIALLSRWRNVVDVTEFPESGGGGDNPGFPDKIKDKRAMKLLLGLRWLDQNKFIDGWDDVHWENIMIRPSTGDFVVSDVGMF